MFQGHFWTVEDVDYVEHYVPRIHKNHGIRGGLLKHGVIRKYLDYDFPGRVLK